MRDPQVPQHKRDWHAQSAARMMIILGRGVAFAGRDVAHRARWQMTRAIGTSARTRDSRGLLIVAATSASFISRGEGDLGCDPPAFFPAQRRSFKWIRDSTSESALIASRMRNRRLQSPLAHHSRPGLDAEHERHTRTEVVPDAGCRSHPWPPRRR
jgi:hypothetical protein